MVFARAASPGLANLATRALSGPKATAEAPLATNQAEPVGPSNDSIPPSSFLSAGALPPETPLRIASSWAGLTTTAIGGAEGSSGLTARTRIRNGWVVAPSPRTVRTCATI